MFKPLCRLSAFTLAFILCSLSLAASEYDFSPNAKIPTDPNVRIGELSNGMKYYIRANKHPEQRAELRLLCHAGSIDEDKSQDGLAHNLEHMLFNGTKHFPKDELLGFLQRIGMRFGADINANTTTERTMYFLQIPTDNKKIIDTAFQVLEDWAHLAALTAEEIDKERGVIIEEWRQRMDAQRRVFEQHNPALFGDSKWGKRNTIGSDTSLLRNYDYEEIRRFYRDWYRPDLQAIVAVGDFDPDDIEARIKKQFGHIKVPANARKFQRPTIKDFDGIRVSIAQDPEFPIGIARLSFRRGKEYVKTIKDYRKMIAQDLYDQMLALRLAELTQKPDPPYMNAFGGDSRFLGNYRAYSMAAVAQPEGIMNAYRTLITEGFRVKQHGFTATELERAKTNYLASLDKSYSERDKSESGNYANEYGRNFLNHEFIPGIEYEHAFVNHIMPQISVKEVNDLAKRLMVRKNAVIMFWLPDKEELKVPSKSEILAVYDEIEKSKLEPYKDEVVATNLLSEKPRGGRIVSESQIKEIGATELKLSNGVRVILKPTDFKNDEIVVRAYSYGGHSLVGESDYMSANMADQIVAASGYGDFNAVQLQKALTGKNLSMRPSIGSLSEGFFGQSTPKDFETFLQLIYLAFTRPRLDDDACKSLEKRLRTIIENSSLNPQSVYNDSLNAILGNYHYRSMPTTMADIEKIDYKKAYEFYKERYADASDFTFIMVGNLDIEKVKPMLETYLGGLPSTKRKETWKDTGERIAKGKVDKKIYKGIMDKSTVNLYFTGDCKWDQEENFMLQSMLKILNMKLREQIREEKGGSYGAYSSLNMNKYPKGEYSINISFNCDSKRVDELVETALDQVRDMMVNLQDESYLQKVKETLRRNQETVLQDNGFWLRSIYVNDFYGDSYKYIADNSELINKFNAEMARKMAKKYFDFDNMLKIVLYAEPDKK